jgi:hypothetical protein
VLIRLLGRMFMVKKKLNFSPTIFSFLLCNGIDKLNICRTRRHQQMGVFSGNDENP